MRHIIVLFLSFFLLFSSIHADDEYSPEEIQGKISTYTKMKVAGFTLLGVGGTSLVVGIALAASADWETHSTPTGIQTTTDDPAGGAGIIMLAVGIPTSIVGIVLSAIGSKKTREYKRRQQLYSIDIKCTPQKQYVGLNFQF